jgi:hypothetical protein
MCSCKQAPGYGYPVQHVQHAGYYNQAMPMQHVQSIGMHEVDEVRTYVRHVPQHMDYESQFVPPQIIQEPVISSPLSPFSLSSFHIVPRR